MMIKENNYDKDRIIQNLQIYKITKPQNIQENWLIYKEKWINSQSYGLF